MLVFWFEIISEEALDEVLSDIWKSALAMRTCCAMMILCSFAVAMCDPPFICGTVP